MVTKCLASILFREEFADVVLICGRSKEKDSGNSSSSEKKIFAHRQILAASSEVFKNMLYGPFVEGSSREIIIPNIEANVMKMLVEFIYTGQVELNSASIIVPLI
jgi:hypothetical protein